MEQQTRGELERRIEELEKNKLDIELELLALREATKMERGYCSRSESELLPLLLAIVNNTQNIVCVTGIDGRYILVNESFCKAMAMDVNTFAGKGPADLFPDSIAKQILENNEKVVTNKSSITFKEKVRFADGIHDFISVKFPIYDKSGTITAIGGILTDITEQVSLEEKLRQSEERFRIAFMTSPDSINLNRASDGKFININDGFTRIMGYTREDVIGKTSIELNIWKNKKDRARLIEGLKNEGSVDNLEAEFVHKNGSVVLGSMSARTMITQGETYIVSIAKDITEIRQTEKEKQRVEGLLRQSQKVEAIGRLAGGIAHDLNNLLVPIIGYGEILKDVFAEDDDKNGMATQIVEAGFKASDLIKQLLAFSRKQMLEYKPLNLNDVVSGVEDLLRRTIPEDIAIHFHLTSGISNILADRSQIEQIVMNLAINARDALLQGGHITLETAQVELDESFVAGNPGTSPGKYVQLSVSDTGCGIDQSTKEKIFEPFFTTKGMLGTGLGLSTVYGIVKQHEGIISVYSEPGQGSTFKVYLPIPQEAVQLRETRKMILDNLTGTETILLVEDDKVVNDLAAKILKANGYTVFAVENAFDALQQAAIYRDQINLLLTDVIMPDMNGRELYDKIAPDFPRLKVIFMSGYTDNIIAKRGVIKDGFNFIQKPFTVASLTTKVRSVLNR